MVLLVCSIIFCIAANTNSLTDELLFDPFPVSVRANSPLALWLFQSISVHYMQREYCVCCDTLSGFVWFLTLALTAPLRLSHPVSHPLFGLLF